MHGAGFIGATRRRPRRQLKATGTFAVALTGLSGGRAQNGSVLGYTENATGTPSAQRWQTSADGTAWADIPSAVGATETIDISGGTHLDTSYVRIGVTISGVECFSNVARLVYAAPAAVVTLSDQNFTTNAGVQSIETAGSFVGEGLSFAVTTIPGVTINSTTGAISFDTEVTSVQSGTEITVTAINSGGSASSTFSLTVSELIETGLVMTIETTAPGETFTLPLRNGGVYNAIVNMGDGNAPFAVATYNDPGLTTTYSTPGTHTIRVSGVVHGLQFSGTAEAPKLRTIENLGALAYGTMREAFTGCIGMTSFTAGNCDTGAVANWYAAFGGCTSMTSCDISGLDFSGATNLQSTWASCSSLTSFDATPLNAATGLQRIDECFLGATGLDAQIDLSGLPVDNLSATGGLFNVVSPDSMGFPVAVYDQMLINFAAQAPLTSGVQMGVGRNATDYTRGGAAEAARDVLVTQGWIINDAGRTAPEAMSAPSLEVNSGTQITAALAPDPGSQNYPILSHDLRYSTDETSWTEVPGITSPYAITGLAEDTLYFVQTRANSEVGNGTWGTSASGITETNLGFSIEEIGEEPVIIADSGTVSITIASGSHAGTHTTDWSGNTLTVSGIEASPVCLILPTVSGTINDGETLAILPGLWIYDGPDLGDQTWQQKLEGVDVSGGTGLTYVIQTTDEDKDFIVEETYGGVLVESAATTLTFSAIVPAQMSAPTLVVDSATQITATKAADPSDGGSPITSYDLRYSTDEATWTGVLGFTSPHQITGLAASTLYYVQERAVNAIGNGAWSASVSGTTAAAGATMAADTGKIAWHQAVVGDLTLSGTDVTGWDNKEGNADWDLGPAPVGAPQWDAANGRVTFNGSSQGLRSVTNVQNLGARPKYDGETVVVMLVVDIIAAQSEGLMVSHSYNTGTNNSYNIGYATNTGVAESFHSVQRFSTEDGGTVAGLALNTPPPASGKMVWEAHLGPTSHRIYVDGVLEYEATGLNSANYSHNGSSRWSVGGRFSASGNSHMAAFNLYEAFVTTSIADVADFRSELNTRHGL